jgi:hypothetical protein
VQASFKAHSGKVRGQAVALQIDCGAGDS